MDRRCFWTAPARGNPCPWLVTTRVSVRDEASEVWFRDCCAGHVTIANQDALTLILETGRGSWHTTKYETSVRVKQRERVDHVFRPYLAIADDHLKSEMINAQQSARPRVSMNNWIIEAIRSKIREVKGNVDDDRSEGL